MKLSEASKIQKQPQREEDSKRSHETSGTERHSNALQRTLAHADFSERRKPGAAMANHRQCVELRQS